LEVIIATLVREFRFFNPEGREGVPNTDYSVSPPSLPSGLKNLNSLTSVAIITSKLR
jgi:hypothetical protein